MTDLHQGIVWGTNTEQTARDERLVNRFDYDGEYGTVLNRFLMQAACGIPLTVYGTGGQTRAFIHISDTCKCIELAVANPPQAGERVEILNQVRTSNPRTCAESRSRPHTPRVCTLVYQVAETARVRDLATMISDITGCGVQRVSNPRNEAAENELDVANRKFKLLGLEPTLLDSAGGLLAEVRDIASKYESRCDRSKVISKSYWNKDRAVAANAGAPAEVGEAAAAAK